MISIALARKSWLTFNLNLNLNMKKEFQIKIVW